jgi:hypothetical protein
MNRKGLANSPFSIDDLTVNDFNKLELLKNYYSNENSIFYYIKE